MFFEANVITYPRCRAKTRRTAVLNQEVMPVIWYYA